MDLAVKRDDLRFLSFFSKFSLKNIERFLEDVWYSNPDETLLIEKQGDLLLL